MKKITLQDIAEIKCGSQVTLSPCGDKVCYVVTDPNLKENGYHFDIHCLNLKDGSCKQLTHDGKESSFIFDDDNTLLFAANRENNKEENEDKTIFYRLPLDGGEAYKAFEVELNATGIYKVDKGLYAIKALIDWNKPDKDKLSKEEIEEEKDYHIFEEVPFWGNGRGFISGKRVVLFLYNEISKNLLRITDKYTNVSSIAIKDNKIAYVARKYENIIPVVSSLNLYDIQTKKNKTLVKQNKYRVGQIAFLKDNLVYLASDMKKWGNGQLDDIYEYNLRDNKSTLIYKNEDELAIGDTPLSDTFFGGGTTLKAVDDKLYFLAMKKYENDIYCLKDNKVVNVTKFKGGINCFDTNGKDIIFNGSKADSLNCIYQYNSKLKEVVNINNDLLKDKYVANSEYVSFVNSSGDKLDGWVLKPINYNPKKKYPGILEIHGGPRCAYGTAFFHEMQTFTSNGYFVFFTNPRGSEGYGEKFADLRGKYGTIDYNDLMEFCDYVLAKYPQIDSKHIGCAGGSYGGFMCNWIEGHTDRFKAIASQRSVSNWVADFGSSEIGVTFDSNEMGATPWSDMEKMWDQSPLKYACNGKTPILFIHSLCDYNCPLEQGIEMFTAMKYFNIDSKMVIFEGENHSLSRSGKPKHRVRRLREMNDWFDKYLKN